MTMAKIKQRYLAVHPGKIIEEGFHPERNEVSESIFSLSNEYMGVRGFFEEGISLPASLARTSTGFTNTRRKKPRMPTKESSSARISRSIPRTPSKSSFLLMGCASTWPKSLFPGSAGNSICAVANPFANSRGTGRPVSASPAFYPWIGPMKPCKESKSNR